MVPLFQAIHNSESNKSKAQKINGFKDKEKIDKPTAVVYRFTSRSTPVATESYKSANSVDAEPFVRVINENTKEFNDLSLALHARRIDFVQIARHLLNEAAEDKNRGNVQQNLLFSAGENHTRINSRNYGCALPAVNKGTEDWVADSHLAALVCDTCTQSDSIQGVLSAVDSLIEDGQSVDRRIKRLQSRVDTAKAKIRALSKKTDTQEANIDTSDRNLAHYMARFDNLKSSLHPQCFQRP